MGLCPLFSIASVLCGFRAVVDIKANQTTRGLKLAWLAMLLGTLITGVWAGGLIWWNVNVRSVINNGPAEAIKLAQAGQLESFEDFFSLVSNDDTHRFLQIVSTRYGMITHCVLNPETGEDAIDGNDLFLGMVPREATLSYLMFNQAGESIPIIAKYQLFEDIEGTNQFLNKFEWVEIPDKTHGDLRYPQSKP
ncbi:MAG: hypothetical protein VX615_03810 [Planctomycetota bacterium]|nr:hypothetical protein [Planctomycetota bacterium]